MFMFADMSLLLDDSHANNIHPDTMDGRGDGGRHRSRTSRRRRRRTGLSWILLILFLSSIREAVVRRDIEIQVLEPFLDRVFLYRLINAVSQLLQLQLHDLFLLCPLFHRLDRHAVHEHERPFALVLEPLAADHLFTLDSVASLDLGPLVHEELDLWPECASAGGQEGEGHNDGLEQVAQERGGRVGVLVEEIEGPAQVGQGFVGVLLQAVELVVDEDGEEIFLEVVFLACGQEGLVLRVV